MTSKYDPIFRTLQQHNIIYIYILIYPQADTEVMIGIKYDKVLRTSPVTYIPKILVRMTY